jgi:hypothetical protein
LRVMRMEKRRLEKEMMRRVWRGTSMMKKGLR